MIIKQEVLLGNTVEDMGEVCERYNVSELFDKLIQFDTRCVETELTQLEMAEKVAKACLEEIDIQRIHVIIFTSNLSTRCIPTTALTLASKLGLRNKNLLAFDLNSNCSGALTAMNIAKEILHENELALIIATDKFTMAETPEMAITHSYGDAATCMVIDNSFQDYYFRQDNNTNYIDEMQLPLNAIQKGNNNMVMHIQGSPSFDEVANILKPQFEDVCASLGKDKDDFAAYCFTQGSGRIIESVTELLDISQEKVPFTGKYTGYAGVCCPLINLDYLVKEKGLKRGDLIFFWSLGAGINSTVCAFRY